MTASASSPSVSQTLSRARKAVKSGDLDAARSLFHAVLARYPANKRARTGLRALQSPEPAGNAKALQRAVGLFRAGQWERALNHAATLLRTDPACVAALEICGACQRRLGAPGKAVPLYRRAVQVAPDNGALWAGLGGAYSESGDLAQASPCWERAAGLAPGDPHAWIGLAQCCLDMGLPDSALRHADRAAQCDATLPGSGHIAAAALFALGRLDAARDRYLALGDALAGDAVAQNALGMIAQAKGDSAAAKRHFERAVQLRPHAGEAHRNLSGVVTYAAGHPHLRRMQALVTAPDTPPEARTQLQFALFKARDDLGDLPGAIAHLHRANAARKAWLGYDISRDEAMFAFIRRVFDSVPAGPVQCPDPGPRPIFVVGLPRSGTTLTEQILAGAPGTHPAGELSDVQTALSPVLKTLRAEGRDRFSLRDATVLADALVPALSARAGGAATIIDKMPLNFRWIGAIAAALPQARFVHVVRDPVATGWSLYRHCFAGRGNGFAYDIADIARYVALQRGLMGFWGDRLGSRLYTLDYDRLTRDPEPEIRALLEFCGLEWSSRCLTPHRAGRQITTASAAQLRQPIHAGSSQGWRRYGPLLGDLVAALQRQNPPAAPARGNT